MTFARERRREGCFFFLINYFAGSSLRARYRGSDDMIATTMIVEDASGAGLFGRRVRSHEQSHVRVGHAAEEHAPERPDVLVHALDAPPPRLVLRENPVRELEVRDDRGPAPLVALVHQPYVVHAGLEALRLEGQEKAVARGEERTAPERLRVQGQAGVSSRCAGDGVRGAAHRVERAGRVGAEGLAQGGKYHVA